MPEYLAPGVYIEEIARGPRPIEGVPTSIAAFIGGTERGPIQPRMIVSYGEYLQRFGGVRGAAAFMPYAVKGFFENGGKNLYVCRVTNTVATTAKAAVGDFTLRAVGPGDWGTRIFAKIEPSTTTRPGAGADAAPVPVGFRLRIAYYATLPAEPPLDWFDDATQPPAPTVAETFDDLEMDAQSPNGWSKRLGESALVTLERNSDTAPGEIPAPAFVQLTAEAEEVDVAPDLADFQGLAQPPRHPQGLAALELDAYRDVALVYAPGASIAVHQAVIDHCEKLRYRFAVVDSDENADLMQLEPRNAIRDTSYAALYAPWLVVADLETGAGKAVPPGGHVLGVYARADAERGVFKAPANQPVQGALDLAAQIDDARQEILNPRGVNAIRRFPERGMLVWGARTLASEPLWKYVNVRRLLIFLERSIRQGTQWVVFEPNGEPLWARVRETIRDFLSAQWRSGALMGQKEEEAFFIACDRRTMTQDDIQNGRLICEIGIAPIRPAEFVIIRIFQNTAEAQC